MLAAAPPAAAQASGDLEFFKNHFLTGDYVVGGVGLRGQGVGGIATGAIAIGGVPERDGVDVVAAYLYWQVVAKQGDGPDAGSLPVTFRGYPLRSADGPFGKVLGAGTAPCWSSGGSTGPSQGANRTYSYRADVLRFLDVDPRTGKYVVNGTHAVQLPDDNSTLALGASLVVIYRDPSLPLAAIVINDGDHTMDNRSQSMTTTIRGFYQASQASPAARLTHIVGSGQANKGERVLVNGQVIASNPFASSLGRGWDAPTFDLSGLDLAGASQLSTTVDQVGVNGADCLTWSAVIFRAEVQDSDGDGLLDVWESSSQTLLDPNGQPLPNLAAMGADPFRPDVFVEVGYMKADADLSYGGRVEPAHTHLPGPEVLKMVGDAFKPRGIAVHFDVGPNYPDPHGLAAPYLVPAPLARGGEAIDETDTVCQRGPADPPWACQFSAYPGTVGWKTGFRFLRDQVLSGGEEWPAGAGDPCEVPGACERRFDRARKDMFRYALFAHAIGLPKSEDPEHPEFFVPRTNTGVGDFRGGDLMITLGGFRDTNDHPVGTPFMQASTLLHELGHTFGLRHGGGPLEPNCKPTYLSVMNYLYQLRGLKDEAGRPHLDFSGDDHASLDVREDVLPYGRTYSSLYLIGWYAPFDGSVFDGAEGPRAPIAARRCDGSMPPPGESLPRMVRVDQRRLTDGIDWDVDGDAGTQPSPIDVNFNGMPGEALSSGDDWSRLVLTQVGGRRNTGGLFVIDAAGRLALGPLSLDTGRGDLGRGDLGRGDLGRGDLGGDLGRGDLGRGDLGRGDLGRGDLGRGDLGRGDLGALLDLGRGDLGRGDLGGGDLFVGDPNGGGELDVETAGELANTPPNEFRACVVGVGDCTDASALTHQVRLDWTASNVGGVVRYVAYRSAGAELSAGVAWSEVGRLDSVPGQVAYTVVDRAPLEDGGQYTYFAVAVYERAGVTFTSDTSNLVTITAVNDAPLVDGLADVTIDENGSSTQSFTIADEHPAAVTLAGSSSNQALVPDTAIVFGGSGAARTVTVTPAPGQSGTATITVTATDAAGRAASASFVLTVRPSVFAFVGLQNVPPPAGKTFKAGSAIPMKWQFQNGATVVDSSGVTHTVAVRGPLPNGPVRVITNTDPGSSSFRYGNGIWTFNLQTKEPDGRSYPVGTYEVVITPSPARYRPSPPFVIRLVK